jgi:hypothetical protein
MFVVPPGPETAYSSESGRPSEGSLAGFHREMSGHSPDMGLAEAKIAVALGAEAPELDHLICDGCGRSFNTIDGPRMLAAIKGGCPDCDGRFELDE